jgi:hypothetical protein
VQGHDDALVETEVAQHVAELGHDIFLDRRLPGLALDGEPERRERVGLLRQHVDLVPAA